MTAKEYIEIIKQAGGLKTTMRHCWLDMPTESSAAAAESQNGPTPENKPERIPERRRESVAEHSWRLTLMAMLLRGEAEFADADLDKVVRMCIIHDLGESFTGDIPAFLKSEEDADTENDIFRRWIRHFPEPQRQEWIGLIEEMDALETNEAKIYKAIDKIEALIAHNESDIATWLPVEYDLQMTYGQENMQFSPFFRMLRKEVDSWSEEKIREGS